MNSADLYRARAAELRARVAHAPTQALALQWENLAKCYTRLAEQADANSFQDLWFEFGPKPRMGEVEGA